MSNWQVGLLIWSVAGFAMATLMDFAMRHEDGRGFLFGHETRLDAVIGLMVALAAFIAWPVFLILIAVEIVRDGPIKEGQAPLQRVRQPVPVAKWPNPSWMPPEDDDELLCRMIRLRFKKDPRLAGQGPPHRWPRESLRQTAEAVLADTVYAYLTLRREGLPPQAICRRLIDRIGGVDGSNTPAGLRSMVRARLHHKDPAYLELGPGVLGAATGLAVRYIRRRIAERLSSPEFPRPDWLGEDLTAEEVERDFEGLVFPSEGQLPDWQERLAAKRREWDLLKLRMGESDGVRRYRAPEGSGCARGLALIRDGQPIDYIAAVHPDEGDQDAQPQDADR